MAETTTIERLRNAGLTATPQRAALLEALETSGEHLSADDLHARVREHHPTISLSTVYEVLDRFAEVGLSATIQAADGVTRHEGRTDPHVNLLCPGCGAIRDLDTPAVERLVEDVRRRTGDRVSEQPVALEGTCRSCHAEGD